MDSISNKENILYDKYNNLSYLDSYGTQIILIILLSIILFLFLAYTYLQSHIETIKSDWPNQRCKPNIIPFAGYIYNDDTTITSSEATKRNLEYCTQNITKELSADALAPLTYTVNNLSSSMSSIADGINSSRGMFDKIRTNLQSVSEEIMGRLLNVTVPIQQMVISFKDMMAKIQGVLTSALYTSMGTYYTLKSLLGAISEFLVKALIALSVMIIMMWLTPFTWGVASTMTAVFIAISVPLALMLAFMSKVLHVNLNLNIPAVPKKPACFDENTLIEIINNKGLKEKIPIKDIKVGDILAIDNAKVTAKMKLGSKDIKMYNINGIIVSDSHLILYDNNWIRIDQHPNAFKITNFNQYKTYNLNLANTNGIYRPIYCLNTTTKKIHINSEIFCDWDEIVTEKHFYHLTTKLVNYINSISDNNNLNINNINNNNKTVQNISSYNIPIPDQNTYNTLPQYDINITKENIGEYTHKYLDWGLNNVDILTKNGFKNINNIKIGDRLYSSKILTNNTVYGIVEVLGNNCFDNKIHLLTEDSEFFVRLHNENTHHLDRIAVNKHTNNTLDFNIHKIWDYNSCIDLF